MKKKIRLLYVLYSALLPGRSGRKYDDDDVIGGGRGNGTMTVSANSTPLGDTV